MKENPYLGKAYVKLENSDTVYKVSDYGDNPPAILRETVRCKILRCVKELPICDNIIMKWKGQEITGIDWEQVNRSSMDLQRRMNECRK